VSSGGDPTEPAGSENPAARIDLREIFHQATGVQYHLDPVVMDFDYENHFSADLPGACERLLLDVMRIDSTLFTRRDELLAAWKFVTPILKVWKDSSSSPDSYNSGTWGPVSADRPVSDDGRCWREPRPDNECAVAVSNT